MYTATDVMVPYTAFAAIIPATGSAFYCNSGGSVTTTADAAVSPFPTPTSPRVLNLPERTGFVFQCD